MYDVAVKALKSRLIASLCEVKHGDIVLVSDRGVVVAELLRPGPGAVFGADDQVLDRLSAEDPFV